MKSEARLSELGICNHRTALASKTAGEFCVRALSKAEKHIQQVLDKQEGVKVVNFCMDAASISHEQATRLQCPFELESHFVVTPNFNS